MLDVNKEDYSDSNPVYVRLLNSDLAKHVTMGSEDYGSISVGSDGPSFYAPSRVMIKQLANALIIGSVPASASAWGTKGDIAYDSSYMYVCTATNTWKRIPWDIW